jgi:MFS family permease
MHVTKADAFVRPAIQASDDGKTMRRIAMASYVGTLIEFYDLSIYSTAAAIVFPSIFFSRLGEAGGTVAAFGTIGVAFVARPLGSIIFGHFGDLVGRKSTLVTCLLMMGLGTIMVGFLPSGDQIGILAPILLVLLRILQGLAAGGEFAGATLFVSESAPPHERGKWSSMPIRGGAIATSLAALTFLLTSLTMSSEAFHSWGWRVPFLLSSVLLVIGLYIRVKMEETSVFKRDATHKGRSDIPFLAAFRAQKREIFLGCLVEVPAFALLYLVLTYVVNFGANDLKLGYSWVLAMTVLSGLTTLASATYSSNLSDRIGRRPVLIAANTLATIWVLALFPILHSSSAFIFGLCVVVSALINGMIFGPVGAFMSELFKTRYRYTAVGLCYNAAGILGARSRPCSQAISYRLMAVWPLAASWQRSSLAAS